MPEWPKELHQPEPWTYEGHFILSASRWRLAKTILEADARRIVAAVNDVQGIPTVALEAGFIRDLLELKIWPRLRLNAGDGHEPLRADAERFLTPGQAISAPGEVFPYDRRLMDRRRR